MQNTYQSMPARDIRNQYDREDSYLRPAAERASASRGRTHPEPAHPLRTPFERDRDRIIHSAAFRRLEYKTQVFVNHEGDYYRTRLTHTLEVAQIARSLARFLQLNEDLAEAVALVHDLGHPPFGHAGEAELAELMAGDGGFEHNRQALRVVDTLEERYSEFPGLNLTWEVREGIVKHSPLFRSAPRPAGWIEFGEGDWPSLEAQAADLADEIAYNVHDVDDGMAAGMIGITELHSLGIWREAVAPRLPESLSPVRQRYYALRSLIDFLVRDAVEATEARLAQWSIETPAAARAAPGAAVEFSAKTRSLSDELRDFLRDRVYGNHRVQRMNRKARRVLRDLWKEYREHPRQLPPEARRPGDPPRALCDYLAGLTDRAALREHARLFDPLTLT